MTQATIKTSGVHCPSCSMMIELSVDELEGVASVKADHATGQATVDYDPSVITVEAIADAIRTAGYGAEIVN